MLASTAVSEVTETPDHGRRWIEQGSEWLLEKQRQGRYQGRNGTEAERVLRRCARAAAHGPERADVADLLRILQDLAPNGAPKTSRFYLAIVGSFLASRGNWVVQESGLRGRFPNRATRQPIVPASDRDQVLNAAQGAERIVTTLLGLGRRRVEILRARVDDFHVDRLPATYDVRQKGGRGQVTDPFPITSGLWKELAWYLPLRREWSSRAVTDSGHLVCRFDGPRLVGVSSAYVDRILHAVERRAGVPLWPAHAFRRGLATILRERGADWEDVSGILGHRSPETTRLYVGQFVRTGRMAHALELLEAPRGSP